MTPWEAVPAEIPLTQGDVLDGCPVFRLTADYPLDRLDLPLDGMHARIVVLTQTCDLANAKATQVQVAVVHVAQKIVDSGILKATSIRDQVRRGQVFGWYFLPESPTLGIPESLVDLRDLHTVPRAVLERLITVGKRVGRLITPFREHLAQHFAVTYMRIALPVAYETRP